MNMRVVLCLCAAVWSCRAVHATEYLFEAHFCEVAEEALRGTEWTLSSGQHITTVSTLIEDDKALRLMEEHAHEVVSLPVLRLRRGEKAEINEQTPVVYPTEFTEEGEPTMYEERGVGLRVAAEWLDEESDQLRIRFSIEQAWLDNWIPYVHNDLEILQPVFGSRNVNTTVLFTASRWLVMGGLMRETDNGRRHHLILIRVRPGRGSPTS